MEDLQAIRPRNPRRGIGRVLQQRVVGPDLRRALAISVDPPDQPEGAVGDIEPAAVVGDAVGLRNSRGERGLQADGRAATAGRLASPSRYRGAAALHEFTQT